MRACWTARHRWTPSSPRWRRGWPSSAGPATSRPARRSTATGGWPACCAAKAPPQPAAAVPTDRYAGNPLALLHAHVTRAIAAAIFGDLAGLARHTAAAMPLLPAARGAYPTAVARLLRGLALAGQARAGRRRRARTRLLAELDEVTGWLAARAADAPANFQHLLRLLEAERAWAVGDFRAAVLAFDAARREVAGRQRPWHRALITEHAARFYLAHGVDHAGYSLLAEARQEYLAWGATAKVDQLDWAYPTLRPAPDTSTDPASTSAADRRPLAAPPSRPARSTCSASCPPPRH